jgi:hypothetical protein
MELGGNTMNDSKGETNYHFHQSARANNEDRAFLVKEAHCRIPNDRIKRNATILWIRNGKRSLRDLQGLARRWGMQLPSDEKGMN